MPRTGRAATRSFNGFMDRHPEFTSFVIADRQGALLCSLMARPGGQVTTIADTPEFQEVMRQDAFVVGQPLVDPISGKLATVLAYPLHDDAGQLEGALRLSVDLGYFQQLLNAATLPQGAVMAILTDEGSIVAHLPDSEIWGGTDAQGAEVVALMLEQPEGYIQARGLDGVERIYSFTSISGVGWRAYAGIAPNVVFGTTRIQTIRNALVGVALLLLMVALAAALSRRITVPISALARATAAAHGHWDMRVPVAGPAEIAEVATRFNALLETRGGGGGATQL